MGVMDFLKSKPVETATTLVALVMAIVSMTSCYKAYSTLKSASTDFEQITVNWNTQPLTAVKVIASSETDCGDGWAPIGPNMTFPGLQSSPCACPDDVDYPSATTSCNSTQTSAGCRDVSLGSISLDIFLNKKTCYQRGGDASVLNYSPYTARPIPSDDVCSSLNGVDYKQCGPGDFTDSNYPICWPADMDCPLIYTDASSTVPSTVTYDGAYGDVTMTFSSVTNVNSSQQYSSNEYLYSADSDLVNSNIILLPIVDLQTAFVKTSSLENGEGPCYNLQTPQEEYTSTGGTFGWNSNTQDATFSLSTTQPASCSKFDTRYRSFAETTQQDLLMQNFVNNYENECIKGGVNFITDTTFNPFRDDCYQDGTCCTTSSSDNSKPQCSTTFATGKTCASDDTLCKKITQASTCSLLYESYMAADNLPNVAMFYRTQIEWKPSCTFSTKIGKQEIQGVVSPLKATTSAQLALVVINTLSGIIVGVFIPLLIIYNIWYDDVPCVAGSGAEEKKTLKGYSSHTSLVLNIVKMIPLIISIVMITKLSGLFTEVSTENCSDTLSNETITYLAETLPNVKQANMTTLGSDVVSLLLAILSVIMSKCSDQSEEDKENSTDNPVQVELESQANAL